MTALTIVALVLAVTVIIAPAVLVWYINIGGAVAAYREAKERRAARQKAAVKA